MKQSARLRYRFGRIVLVVTLLYSYSILLLHFASFIQNKAAENMLSAIWKKDAFSVNIYLFIGANPNAQNSDGQSMLQLSVIGDNIAICKSLLNSGANPNYLDKVGMSPLHTACEYGNSTSVALLIKYGAALNIKSNNMGATPLFLATMHHKYEIVNVLIKNGADVNSLADENVTPLHIWADDKDCPLIIGQALISAKANVNSVDENGDTPLHRALISYLSSRENSYKNKILLLLKSHADLSKKNRHGITPQDLLNKLQNLGI